MNEKHFIRINDKDLFNTSEVAQILGVSQWTVVYKYIDGGNGILKARKLGNGTSKRGSKRHWRIKREDLLDFINRGGKEEK